MHLSAFCFIYCFCKLKRLSGEPIYRKGAVSGPLGGFGGVLGRSWGDLGWFWGVWGRSWGALGRPWEGPWEVLGGLGATQNESKFEKIGSEAERIFKREKVDLQERLGCCRRGSCWRLGWDLGRFGAVSGRRNAAAVLAGVAFGGDRRSG